jgi:hypothetical protein
MDKENLRIFGLTAYLCEGTKLRKDNRYKNTYLYVIEFTNSDPNLMKLFIDFMRQELEIDENKIKCQIAIYNDLKAEKIEKFWSNYLDIPICNFNKVIIFKPKNLGNKINLRGTCKLRYYSKNVFLKLNELVVNHIGNESSLIK